MELPNTPATADAPQIPTQDSPVDNQLQPPATAAPAPSPLANLQPSMPPVTATSPNKHLMSLGARILGALAGSPTPSYQTDASGKMTAVPSAPMTTGQKIKRITDNALVGLSAGASVPEGKSALASGLAGAGAGAKAQQEQALQRDSLAQAHERENYEQQQQTKLRGHEIARLNALTYATELENEKRQNDLDPSFAANESLYNAIKNSPELGAHIHELSGEQALQTAEKDPNFLTTHIVRRMGRIPVTDENGKPVMVTDEDGVPAPKMQTRFMVVDGTKDGKFPITGELEADVKHYGAMARIPGWENIKKGDSYPIDQIVPLLGKIEEQRKVELEGWQKAEMGWSTDPKTGKESPVLINKNLPPGSPDSIRALTVKPLAMKEAEDKSALEKAQAGEAYGKEKEALAAAALSASLLNGGGGNSIPVYMEAISKLPESSQAILKNVPPAQQVALLKVANGDADINKIFPTRTTKGSGQLDAGRASTLVSLINPAWNEGMFSTKQKAQQSFADGEDGKAIGSFGQFFVHAADLKAASERVQRTNSPLLNRPLNYVRSEAMGQPGIPGLMTAIQTTRSEWQNFIKNGHAADLADSEQGRAIMSDKSSPAQILDAAREMGLTGIGRLDQIDAKWRRTWGGHYPGLISDSARQGATELGLGDQLKQYPAESGAMFGVQAPSSQSGQPNTPPAPQTHIFDPAAWSKANPNGDVNAAIASAKQQGYQVKQ